VIAKAVPIRAGLFTDFAASPDPQHYVTGAPVPSDTQHVDRYGATLSLGYRTEHTATDVGAIVSYGEGHTFSPQLDPASNLTPVLTKETQLYTYVFVTSSYAF
jgi:hypothetical protein